MTSPTRNLHSQALDLLRFPLACIIVFVHIFTNSSVTVQGITYPFADMPLTSSLVVFARCFLSAQSMPIYFFIAGYVFFVGINFTMDVYERKMKNRFRSLVIPYFVWNIIAFAVKALPLIPIIGVLSAGEDKVIALHLANFLEIFWNNAYGVIQYPNVPIIEGADTYPIDFPLWFVRDLIIVAITTPMLSLLLRKFKRGFILALGLAWYLLPLTGLGHLYQILTAYFFFSLGAYLSIHGRDVAHEFKRVKWFGYIGYPVAAIALFLYVILTHQQNLIMTQGFGNHLIFLKNAAVLTGLIFAFNLAMACIRRWQIRVSKNLATASFFIYAAHGAILTPTGKLVGAIITPYSDLHCAAYLLTEFALLSGGLLLLFLLMKRLTPSLLRPLIGGRL